MSVSFVSKLGTGGFHFPEPAQKKIPPKDTPMNISPPHPALAAAGRLAPRPRSTPSPLQLAVSGLDSKAPLLAKVPHWQMGNNPIFHPKSTSRSMFNHKYPTGLHHLVEGSDVRCYSNVGPARKTNTNRTMDISE